MYSWIQKNPKLAEGVKYLLFQFSTPDKTEFTTSIKFYDTTQKVWYDDIFPLDSVEPIDAIWQDWYRLADVENLVLYNSRQ